jgi:hypothetical protein
MAEDNGMMNSQDMSGDSQEPIGNPIYPLTKRQDGMYELYADMVEEYGKFDQGSGPDGAHYGPGDKNPFQKSGLLCANCVQYDGPRGCEVVKGDIDPLGICKLWIIPKKLIVERSTEEYELSTNHWKITIPVDRAEETADGLYIYGQASGPERDSHGTEMDTTAIEDFAKQIEQRASAGDPIPYLDHHQKDGVLRELGSVVSGSVDSDYRLNVAVRLDAENPAALYLHSRIKNGKQYGMSIAGDGVQYKVLRDETTGEQVIRFLRIALKEISNTTRPSWVPSFGTVLARSIDSEENGEVMAEELVKADAPAEQVENVATESAAPVVADVVEEQAPVEAPAEEVVPVEAAAPEAEVDRARIAKKDAKAFMAALKALHEQVAALGITEEEETAAKTEEAVAVEATAPDDDVDFNGVVIKRDLADAITAFVTAKVDESTAVLRETVDKQAEYIKALEEMPAGKVPAAVVREKFESDEIDLGSMAPEDRLRYALNNIYKK